jgi:uncharacterized protein YdcH (DUF465 family)
VGQLREMYPSLDHLISADEGGIDHIVDEETNQLEKMKQKGIFDNEKTML